MSEDVEYERAAERRRRAMARRRARGRAYDESPDSTSDDHDAHNSVGVSSYFSASVATYSSPQRPGAVATALLTVLVVSELSIYSAALFSAYHLIPLASTLYYVSVLAAGVCFLWWFYRVYKNLNCLTGVRRFDPFWVIGSFVLPVINLFRPYQLMREVWDHSILEVDRGGAGVVKIWWALLLGSGAVTLLVTIMSDDLRLIEAENRSVSVIDLSLFTLWTINTVGRVVTILLIRKINEAQQACADGGFQLAALFD